MSLALFVKLYIHILYVRCIIFLRTITVFKLIFKDKYFKFSIMNNMKQKYCQRITRNFYLNVYIYIIYQFYQFKT